MKKKICKKERKGKEKRGGINLNECRGIEIVKFQGIDERIKIKIVNTTGWSD